jgi:hypothetical protein
MVSSSWTRLRAASQRENAYYEKLRLDVHPSTLTVILRSSDVERCVARQLVKSHRGNLVSRRLEGPKSHQTLRSATVTRSRPICRAVAWNKEFIDPYHGFAAGIEQHQEIFFQLP